MPWFACIFSYCVVQYLNVEKDILELETFREGHLGWIVL